jgi:hypothetical protein
MLLRGGGPLFKFAHCRRIVESGYLHPNGILQAAKPASGTPTNHASTPSMD